ncbi:MAG: hypothetical protein IKK95_01445 [Lachnospiraceae bacterium]|nr:hypothetical protein [Lachnospiraceae bacterium]
MDKKDMLYYFLSSSKNTGKRIKVTGGQHGVVKGVVRELVKDNNCLTVLVDDATYVIDLNKNDVRTGVFDSRVIYVDGEDALKFQLC